MIPQSQPKKAKNSSKVNLTISAVFHTVLILALVYFAAREGYLGKKIQKISVEMVKEKPPEKPKEQEKPKEPPKVEQPKLDTPKMAEPPKQSAPPSVAPPVVAPASTEIGAFRFTDGYKAVDESSDPVYLYKGYMEYELRSQWDRPENMDDASFAVFVQVNVDKKGNLSNPVWSKLTGNKQWDDSVRAVFDVVKKIGHAPPTNFPPQVTIRFDTVEQTEPLIAP